MNRSDFQFLARLRVREARALRDRELWNGCYYLSGHAVECALKACLARMTRRYDFPDKKRVLDSHTHDLSALLKLANLEAILKHDAVSRPAIGVNWSVVKDWNVESRYNPLVTEQQGRDLLQAVAQPQTGVIAWVSRRW